MIALCLLTVPCCGVDEPIGASSPEDSDPGDAAPDGPAIDSDSGTNPACVFSHDVTLPGHEGQFFGTPFLYCQTFIPGTPNGGFVVVGSDVAATGDHDCLLARAVRYHVDWGDGTCSWTERLERCDVRTTVEHSYSAPGSYLAKVFAEDDEGLRTRAGDKTFVVLLEGGDVFLSTGAAERVGGFLKFEQLVGAYGNLPLAKLTVSYTLRQCDGSETELERRDFTLPTTTTDQMRNVTADIEIAVSESITKGYLIVEVDPDRAVPETCPESGSPAHTRGLNNLTSLSLGLCPIFQ
jgi:hypothetical protein